MSKSSNNTVSIMAPSAGVSDGSVRAIGIYTIIACTCHTREGVWCTAQVLAISAAVISTCSLSCTIDTFSILKSTLTAFSYGDEKNSFSCSKRVWTAYLSLTNFLLDHLTFFVCFKE